MQQPRNRSNFPTMSSIFTRQIRNRLLPLILICSLAIPATAQSPVGFGVSNLSGASSYLATSLQFGLDNRLYVAQQDGIIKAYTIVRLAANSYIVTSVETILEVNNIPNHNDNGTPNPSVNYRQITGIMLGGTASNPVIWVTSSDPRIGAGPLGTDTDLDTNSGIISTLTWNGSSWVRQDLVRGLPRSEENHSLNGLVLDTVANILYVCAGGNTNMGARSNNFALAPEYAYSAAILSVDLNAISSFPYDLPTLNDEDRAGAADFNDPFGGNDGKNQAKLEVGGPVQVYASGFRNPYDILINQQGRLYSWDNGPNANWGGPPATCADVQVEGGPTYTDGLHFIPSAGYYGGHPNLTRANRSNTFNASNPQSPVPVSLENPIECTYLIPKVENDAIVLHAASTNGISEYTASNFEGAMTGFILAATFDGKIIQVELNETGDGLGALGKSTLFSGFGSVPLDVIAIGDDGLFPGTIWSANIFGAAPVTVFEPSDYDGGSGSPCEFGNPLLDADSDGYTNGDELDNLTNPCSAADKPSDWDGDFVSDLNDPDDDNDGILDIADKFALDATNGASTFLPVDYEWEPGDPSRGGFFDLGFTGMMNNGNSDYINQYDPVDITAGGTAGLFTIDAMTEGTAFSTLNTQDNAFQFGVNVDTVTRPFVIQTRIRSPFGGASPVDFQNMGMFFGTGDMDNYIKLVVHSKGGAGGIEYLQEEAASVTNNLYAASVIGATYVDLFLNVDPIAGTVQPFYSVNGGFPTAVGGARNFPLSWINSIMAVGIIGTSNGPGPEFPATWDYIIVEPLGPKPSATLNVFAGNFLTSDASNNGSYTLTNTSINGGKIDQVTVDLSTLIQPDMVFDPIGTAADNIFKNLTANSGDSATGFLGHSFDGLHDGGYDKLILNFSDFDATEVFTFSVDIDPTSIKGLNSPGPNSASRVCGLELIGAKVDILFDNDVQIGGQLFMTPASFGGSKNRFDEDTIAGPSLSFDGGMASPSFVTNLNQTVRVHGPAGAFVRLVQLEGGMFLRGNSGFDVDPFESNSIIKRTEYNATVGLSGFVNIPVTLTVNDVEGGLNHFVAVIDGGIKTSNLSNILILQVGEDTTGGGELITEVNINCGGPAYTAVDGTQYQADQYFGGVGSTTYTNNTIPNILGTTDDLLYRTERSNTNLVYNIPMQNGDYEVVLHFAEIFFGAAGGGLAGPNRRVFDGSIEGVQVIDNLDIFNTVSHSTALVMTFPITLTDEVLNLSFLASINRAKLSAIQVRPAIVEPVLCTIDSVVIGAQSACNPVFITYSQTLTIYAGNAPVSGLVVVNGQSYAVASSPQTVVLVNLPSNGLPVNLSVAYSLDSLCVYTLNSAWTAPEDCTPAPVCAVPSNVVVAVLSNKAQLDWDDVPGATRYQLSGRRAGTTNFRFIITLSSNRLVGALTPGTTYEYKIRAACPGDTSDFSPIGSFTTLVAKTGEGIADATGLNNLSLSPNPAIDFVMVQVGAAQDGPAVLTITDLAGRTVLSLEVEMVAGQNTVTLQTGNLQNGLYFVEMRQAAHSAVSRLEVIR